MAYYYFQFTSAGSKSQVDLLISDPNNAAVMGIVCNIFTIVFFASPLVAMVSFFFFFFFFFNPASGKFVTL